MTSPLDKIGNVLIVGAGPAGAITACALAATNPALKITVIDNRSETRRNYALNFAKDAIDAIQNIFKKNLGPTSQPIQPLVTLLNLWNGRAISTLDIESKLAEQATKLGVTILRKDAYKPILKGNGFDLLLAPNIQRQLSSEEQELRSLFQSADIIIGADGAHSEIRQKFMKGGDEEKRAGVKNLQYFIELKYQTHQETQQLSSLKKIIQLNPSKQGVAFETMGKDGGKDSKPLKPATKHFFVGQKTYESFSGATNEKPWSLEDIQEHAAKDPIVQNQACKMTHYLLELAKRKGCCVDAKIKGLPITIYRSSQAVAMHERKIIATLGDAFSGAVFARGVNKAWLEAAQLVEAINTFYSRKFEVVDGEVPEPFKKYEQAVFKIYEKERKWAEFKASGLKIVRTLLRSFVKSVKWFLTPVIWIITPIQNRFFKKPTLGELVEQLQGTKKS